MFKGTIFQSFHWYLPNDGKFWNQLAEAAPKLKSLGFSAVWMPPAFKAQGGKSDVGYGTYDLFDLGEFDQKGTVRTKYGTKEEYIQAIKAIHDNGMHAVADIVLNHKAGADELEKMKVVKIDPKDRNNVISEPFEIEAYTKFTFPGRKKKYSEFIWDHTCFTAVDSAKGIDEKGVFRILNDSREGWQKMVSDELGNYDFLMFNDVDFRNDHVRGELNYWAKWYFDQVHFDGVRLDAVKHMPAWFYNEWLDTLRKNTGEEIFAVAEYWSPGKTESIVKYLEATEGRVSLFDATLQNNFCIASKKGKEFNISCIFDDTLVKSHPQNAVTLVGNHDTQPLQALEAYVKPWFRPIAYALILLRDEGYPCIFYPDLFGAEYKDKDKEGNEQNITLPKTEHIETLLELRCDHAYGKQRDYFDHPNCIGWTREGDDKHSGCAVVLSNGEEGEKEMEIGKRYAGKKFVDALGKRKEEVEINKEGWSKFFSPAGSVSVWVAKE